MRGPIKEVDHVDMMPVETGYFRLAMLEWTNDVAKAARGMTSVATIEPPIHAPQVWDPVTDPATTAPRGSPPLPDNRPRSPSEYQPEIAAHELVAASYGGKGPEALLSDHRRGQRPSRVQPHPWDQQQAGRQGGNEE